MFNSPKAGIEVLRLTLISNCGDNASVQYGHSNSCELALDWATDQGDTIFLLLATGGNRFWTYIYIYINKGCNFKINVIHSAPTFLGLQPSGFRLSQADTFFYWSQSNFLQDNNPLIKKIPAKTHWTYENLFGRQGFVHSVFRRKFGLVQQSH